MKQIELVGGLLAIVDDEYYEVLYPNKWRARKVPGGDLVYAYVFVGISNIDMHRLVAGAKNGQVVDHINGSTLDNRKCNLRICTQGENARNAKKRKITKFRYKGISKPENRSTWQSKIRVNGKVINLGCYKTEIEAAYAYDVAARKYFGEFASLNFENSIVDADFKFKLRKNTSKYKGVSAYKGKWGSSIYFDGKMHYIGYFTDEIEAAKAYDAAARKYYGEFAATNFE